MEVTDRILLKLKGNLGTTVVHPAHPGKWIVKGWCDSGLKNGWLDMPAEMQVDRPVIYCRPAADAGGELMFFLLDDVETVDAPTHMVVQTMLDIISEIESEHSLTKWDVIDILEGRSDISSDCDNEEDQ